MSLLADAVRDVQELSGSGSRGITPSLLEELSTSSGEARSSSGEDPISTIKQANKLISQLIAKAWLQDDRNLVNRDAIVKILMDVNHIDGPQELDLVIDHNPYEFWGLGHSDPPPPLPPAKNYEGYMISRDNPVGVKAYVPFPERPPEATDQDLTEWVQQSPSQEPVIPNVVWIPATC